ncbi:MAG: 50S ribosome-binding GTPase [Sedimentisphaerales bacterium]|nr:50S ribosome-binding GTPase [Sedimentisphaerales bacterium]
MVSAASMQDTIVAISSAVAPEGTVAEAILRISGPDAFEVVRAMRTDPSACRRRGVARGALVLEEGLCVEAQVYSFPGPCSYTGEDLAELHVTAPACVIERLLDRFSAHVRPARPGEFTLRAYLNGKIDLSQAEAVAEIVSGSNLCQVDAAQKLLAGRLGATVQQIRNDILDLLSLLEAGMDFPSEEIEFITTEDAVRRVQGIVERLEELLEGSIHYEALIDLPSVGLCGLPNAGKSSLLNALLGVSRSIVSDRESTTRDVLTGICELPGGRCALFDCAGLTQGEIPGDLLGSLMRQASLEALRAASLALFCVDAGKADLTADRNILQDVSSKQVLFVATKCDMLGDSQRAGRLAMLEQTFGLPFLATSAVAGMGLPSLRQVIADQVIRNMPGGEQQQDRFTINCRHRRHVEQAAAPMRDAAGQIRAGNIEIAALLLRSACESLRQVESETIDEAILERIFAKFCIGK